MRNEKMGCAVIIIAQPISHFSFLISHIPYLRMFTSMRLKGNMKPRLFNS